MFYLKNISYTAEGFQCKKDAGSCINNSIDAELPNAKHLYVFTFVKIAIFVSCSGYIPIKKDALFQLKCFFILYKL